MIGPTGRAIYFGERYFMHYRPEWIVCRPHDLPDFVLDLHELSEQQVQAWLMGFAAADRLYSSFEDSPYADYDHYAWECLMPLTEVFSFCFLVCLNPTQDCAEILLLFFFVLG